MFGNTTRNAAKAESTVHSPQALLPLPDIPLLHASFRALKARNQREAAGGRLFKSKQPLAPCCRARGRPTGRT